MSSLLNLARNDRIRQLRLDGVGVREIAQRLALSPGVVAGVLNRAGLCHPQPRRPRKAKTIRVRAMARVPIDAPIRLPRKTMREIAQEVAAEHGLPLQALLSSRVQAIARVRQGAMWRMRKETPHSFPRIGQFFGLTHPAIFHGVRAYERRIAA